MLIENLRLFLRIVERGGLAVAGREIGLSPATVTERLAALEAHYGARLLTRTTRSVSLTSEGRSLVKRAKRIIAEVEDAEALIKLRADDVAGPIRVTATHDLGRHQLVPILDSFIERYPDVSIDLILSDAIIDVVDQGVDFALRYGDLSDSSMKSKKVRDNRRIVCASPDYLARQGVPQHPDDLVHHNCIVIRYGIRTVQDWGFIVDGRRKTYRVSGNRTANNGDLVRHWCLLGKGLVYKSEWDVRNDLDRGALVPVLEAFETPPNWLRIIYPAGAVQPRRVRLLMDYLAEVFPMENAAQSDLSGVW